MKETHVKEFWKELGKILALGTVAGFVIFAIYLVIAVLRAW